MRIFGKLFGLLTIPTEVIKLHFSTLKILRKVYIFRSSEIKIFYSLFKSHHFHFTGLRVHRTRDFKIMGVGG